jgi:hypothetical protein
MEWSKKYEQDNPPTQEDICRFVGSGLWESLNAFLQGTYGVCPKAAYSKCVAQKGWNVKYQKSGRSLCTLYPMNGYFIALVVVGEREMPHVEGMLPSFSNYVQALYGRTPFSAGGRWLMIEVKSPDALEDVKRLIKIRVSPGKRATK